jgi:hypothetical protein
MKNIPDKIYVHKVSALELDVKIPYSVEYVRKDAFVKKACEFIKDNGSCYIDIVNGQLVLKKSIIKDFKKYMEE